MFIVTGANGFIGSALVWELNEKGIEDILCCDTVSLSDRPELLKKHKYSHFENTDNILPYLKENNLGSKIRAIFHLGACSSTLEMDREYLAKNNTFYTQQLFEYCLEKNIPFIYASSGAVYGGGQQGFRDDVDPEKLEALNPYGESKLNFDRWVLKQSKTPARWYGLRFFNVYGPNEYHKEVMSSVAYKAFLQIKETGQLKLFMSNHPDYKDGFQMRDFVYVKDITRWMWEIYENPNMKSGIYNMGFGQARPWHDLASAAFENLNIPLNINWIEIPENLKEQYQYFTEANIDRLLKQGLSAPQWSLDDGMKDYYTNYLLKDDPYL